VLMSLTRADVTFAVAILAVLLALSDRLTKWLTPRAMAERDKKLAQVADDTISPQQRVEWEHRLSQIEARLAQYNGAEVRDRLTKLEAQFAPFAKILEVELGRMFHSPHTPEVDELIERNERAVIHNSKQDELSRDEVLTLLTRARQIADSEESPGVKVAARVWMASLVSHYAHYHIRPEEVLSQ
jgi:hypothetical protein